MFCTFHSVCSTKLHFEGAFLVALLPTGYDRVSFSASSSMLLNSLICSHVLWFLLSLNYKIFQELMHHRVMLLGGDLIVCCCFMFGSIFMAILMKS